MIGERSTMPMAYVLINTEIGSEHNVLEALKKVEGVEEAHNLWGVYDIIASIKTDTMDKLTAIITKKIETIANINAKLTMIITETQTSPILFATTAVQNG
jgi:DNA-binding Lrp family transcriptional regulator